MNSKPDVHECSVLVAFAELERLERDRSSFARAKHDARERLGRQARDIEALRERLLAERPRAWARVRRARVRANEHSEQQRLLAVKHADAEHAERLSRYAAELELKRARLAELAAQPVVERPARRVLEWSMPAAATMLVAFVGMLAFGEQDASADVRARVIEAPTVSASASLEHFHNGSLLAPAMLAPAEPEPVAAPAPAEQPKKSSSKSSKSSKSASKSSKSESSKPAPVTNKRHDPVKLGGFDGNPLG